MNSYMESLAKTHADHRVVHERNAESFNHAHEINKNFGSLGEILDWCKREMTGEWRWQLLDYGGGTPGRYIFYFDLDRDYVLFTLKWC